MTRRLLLGAVAGALATIPQSAVVWGLRAVGFYRRRAAPEQVAARITGGATESPAVPDLIRRTVKVAGHFGYGALSGAAYAASTPSKRHGPLSGLAAGLTIWATSYLGWLPLLRILPAPHKDERDRQLTMFLAHIAYGATLGMLMRRFARGS